jgi:hypothetical protein
VPEADDGAAAWPAALEAAGLDVLQPAAAIPATASIPPVRDAVRKRAVSFMSVVLSIVIPRLRRCRSRADGGYRVPFAAITAKHLMRRRAGRCSCECLLLFSGRR